MAVSKQRVNMRVMGKVYGRQLQSPRQSNRPGLHHPEVIVSVVSTPASDSHRLVLERMWDVWRGRTLRERGRVFALGDSRIRDGVGGFRGLLIGKPGYLNRADSSNVRALCKSLSNKNESVNK